MALPSSTHTRVSARTGAHHRRGVPRRQATRRAMLLLSFIAFPVTINYFSPYLIIQGAFEGVATGSLLVFGLLFAGSLVLGRAWCGWACPAGGLQEAAQSIRNRPVGKKLGWVKWGVWLPWLAVIVLGIVRAGGYHTIDPWYGTVGGVSVAGSADRPILAAYVIYFLVVLLFLGLALAFGRRAGCHTLCWMAPFMIIGRSLASRLRLPSLRLAADPQACTECGRCTQECPMSIDVGKHVAEGRLDDSSCILCGTCADVCRRRAIHFTFGR